eukprot:TRINITY_DN100685_c0_g1_i1.p1 TRINITY_DN100685_c0_g1~~TRINITY_DN100685_c0_g1_i1.p1  ORF type:complete len:453 (-),score=80.16 TRINITY_DN100685_c0_g1_i1:280-1638(-)
MSVSYTAAPWHSDRHVSSPAPRAAILQHRRFLRSQEYACPPVLKTTPTMHAAPKEGWGIERSDSRSGSRFMNVDSIRRGLMARFCDASGKVKELATPPASRSGLRSSFSTPSFMEPEDAGPVCDAWANSGKRAKRPESRASQPTLIATPQAMSAKKPEADISVSDFDEEPTRVSTKGGRPEGAKRQSTANGKRPTNGKSPASGKTPPSAPSRQPSLGSAISRQATPAQDTPPAAIKASWDIDTDTPTSRWMRQESPALIAKSMLNYRILRHRKRTWLKGSPSDKEEEQQVFEEFQRQNSRSRAGTRQFTPSGLRSMRLNSVEMDDDDEERQYVRFNEHDIPLPLGVSTVEEIQAAVLKALPKDDTGDRTIEVFDCTLARVLSDGQVINAITSGKTPFTAARGGGGRNAIEVAKAEEEKRSTFKNAMHIRRASEAGFNPLLLHDHPRHSHQAA